MSRCYQNSLAFPTSAVVPVRLVGDLWLRSQARQRMFGRAVCGDSCRRHGWASHKRLLSYCYCAVTASLLLSSLAPAPASTMKLDGVWVASRSRSCTRTTVLHEQIHVRVALPASFARFACAQRSECILQLPRGLLAPIFVTWTIACLAAVPRTHCVQSVRVRCSECIWHSPLVRT